MSKKFDNLFAAIMFAAAVAVVLVGGWCLYHSIRQVEAAPATIPADQVHIALPALDPLPAPTPCRLRWNGGRGFFCERE